MVEFRDIKVGEYFKIESVHNNKVFIRRPRLVRRNAIYNCELGNCLMYQRPYQMVIKCDKNGDDL